MFLALEEAPFVLQGPKPAIPPSAWESYGPMALVVVALLALATWAIRRFARRGPVPVAPIVRLEQALSAAESADRNEAVAQSTQAFRAYLAAVEPRAAASLSTEELGALLAGLPVFLPARQPLTAALRSADAVKFAGATPEVPLLIAGFREAARRVEEARRTFARPAVAPLLPPRPLPPAAVPTDTPPPLPGPPPLPRRDHA